MPTTSAARTKLQDATDWAPLTCKLWSVCEPCSELLTLDSGRFDRGQKSSRYPITRQFELTLGAFFAYIVRCGHPVRSSLTRRMIARRIVFEKTYAVPEY